MGFTKLDENIIYSSVMGEDDSVFRVWIILLASCKSTGISPLSPVFIKNITGKTLEEINRCLKILSEPDINSRSKNDEGRRIRSVDGGFEIINYKKYRDFTYSDSPEAIKKRKQRDKSGHVPDISGHSASASDSASISASDSDSNTETNPQYRSCSELLLKRILERRQPKITADTLPNWDNEVRLMIKQEKRTIEDIQALINECHDMQPRGTGGFTWRDQILSMAALRKRWNEGKISIGMNKEAQTQSTGRPIYEYERNAASKYDKL